MCLFPFQSKLTCHWELLPSYWSRKYLFCVLWGKQTEPRELVFPNMGRSAPFLHVSSTMFPSAVILCTQFDHSAFIKHNLQVFSLSDEAIALFQNPRWYVSTCEVSLPKTFDSLAWKKIIMYWDGNFWNIRSWGNKIRQSKLNSSALFLKNQFSIFFLSLIEKNSTEAPVLGGQLYSLPPAQKKKEKNLYRKDRSKLWGRG